MSIVMEQISQRIWCEGESNGRNHVVGNRLYRLGEGRGFDGRLLSILVPITSYRPPTLGAMSSTFHVATPLAC